MSILKTKQEQPLRENSKLKRLLELFLVSTKLGITSFGGPIAHLGYFHEEYIKRRKWLDERSYAELVAVCQILPGPASSQVGIGIGIMRGGLLGGLVAWFGFTLPSVLALVLFAYFLQGVDTAHAGWIHGLKIVAVAIVAHAVMGMAKKLAPDRSRATIAILAAAATLLWPTAFTQITVIFLAGLLGWSFYRTEDTPAVPVIHVPIKSSAAVLCLTLFGGLLIFLPVLNGMLSFSWLAMFDSFYRAGSLVFGGGHVVLPLLEREVLPAGWLTKEQFLAGYGAAQAVPGPLFTFAAYLGAVRNGWTGAVIATIAIFLPAFLLVAGTLPFWDTLRQKRGVQGTLVGVNAAVVGILLAALYDPIWVSSIQAPADFVLAAILFGLLTFWKAPPWIIVPIGALGGIFINSVIT
ncbi:chromate transporter [Brevibacillus reuszeri]|uniref:Chromate transporter n=1 Tax=Brevibacillus reuszeri TaxID=54915 RepID=A0ABQ0TKP7_9BACL|nr:chromate transporter [Brevibacillus reuszeri]MED1856830.1 chromate transporter [Brevibacillus reuszeri]GED68420.1 chromate transporter [Brevibacillus reuszeri]